jgi:hypothetical protein
MKKISFIVLFALLLIPGASAIYQTNGTVSAPGFEGIGVIIMFGVLILSIKRKK